MHYFAWLRMLLVLNLQGQMIFICFTLESKCLYLSIFIHRNVGCIASAHTVAWIKNSGRSKIWKGVFCTVCPSQNFEKMTEIGCFDHINKKYHKYTF